MSATEDCKAENLSGWWGVIGLVSVCALCVSCGGIYRLCRIYNSHDVHHGSEFIWMTLAFYSMSTLSSVCSLSYEISICHREVLERFKVPEIMGALQIFAYVSHWISMLGIFFFRLKMSFENSVLELRRIHQHVFTVVICVIIIMFAITELGFITHLLSVTALCVTSAAMVFTMGMYSQILMFLFVRGLYIINTVSQRDQQLVSIVVRQSILVVVSFVSSTFVIIAYVFHGHEVNRGVDAEWWAMAAGIAVPVDVLVDVICVSLGLTLFDRAYELLCSQLDRCTKSCCEKAGNKFKRISKLRMSKSVSTDVELVVSAALSNQPAAGNETAGDVPNDASTAFHE